MRSGASTTSLSDTRTPLARRILAAAFFRHQEVAARFVFGRLATHPHPIVERQVFDQVALSPLVD